MEIYDEMTKNLFLNQIIIHNYFYFKILCKFIFCISGCFYFIITFNYKELYKTYFPNHTQLYFLGKNAFLTKETINNFNSFINICLKGIFHSNNKYHIFAQPKISVIMPIYNGGKYLHYSLRSIQNQKMKNIEIILIEDCSSDNSIEIIKKYMKEDNRIKLIKNEKKRKILYSKSIGALNANGKYIVQLDQDDMFISDDAFNILYNEAKKDNLDLLQFRDITSEKLYFDKKVKIGSKKYGNFINPNENVFLTQPKITQSFLNRFNFLLWGLLIKKEIYRKGVFYLWPIIINYQIINYEDYSMSFLFSILAKNFKYINFFCLLHIINKKSITHSFPWKEYHLSLLLFINNILDYHIRDNPKDIDIIVNLSPIFIGSKIIYPDFFDFLFKKILANNYLSNELKNMYINKLNVNNTFNFKLWNTYEYFMNSENYDSIYLYQNFINAPMNIKNEESSFNPLFSIIIYYNKKNFLEKTINSIINQNMKNYEIIIMYDSDNKFELIQINNLISNCKKVKIINNKKIGLLNSYFSGILESKGQYILTIKSGYTLATENVLNELFSYIEKNVEILEFNLLINKGESIKNNSLELYKCSHFQSKINTDLIKFNKKYKNIDIEKELLINKLVRSDIYRDIINEFNQNFYGKILYNYYDDIISYIIKKKGYTIKHIKIFGIIEYSTRIKDLYLNIINKNNKIQAIKDTLFFINFLYDYSNNTKEDKQFAINELYNNLNIIFSKYNTNSDETTKVINKFLNSNYISQYDKNNLKLYYNSLNKF